LIANTSAADIIGGARMFCIIIQNPFSSNEEYQTSRSKGQ